MKKLIPIVMLLAFGLLFVGCGDDDDGGTNGNGETTPTLVADTLVTAPAMTAADEAVWDTVDSLVVTVAQGVPPSSAGALGTAVASEAHVKAIKKNNILYLQMKWADPDHSIWPGYYYVADTAGPLQFARSVLFNEEDQMFALFTTPENDWWDVWGWSVVSTGAADLARGYRWRNDSLLADTNTSFPQLEIIDENPGWFIVDEPTYCHVDTSEFNGHILFTPDSVLHHESDWLYRSPTDSIHWYQTEGWVPDQRIPGVMLDVVAVGRAGTAQDSRFDIVALADYDSTASLYTLVMARDLNTGFSDDLDLAALDSVEVQLAVFDNLSDFDAGSSRRGISEKFYLRLK